MFGLNITLKSKQLGVTAPQILFALLASGMIAERTYNYQTQSSEISDTGARQAIIVQLAKAQARHITDDTNPHVGTYAADPATLNTRGYLPVWNGDPDYTFNFPASGLEVVVTTDSTKEAVDVAKRFGSIATTSGNDVTVGFSDPMSLSMFDQYVDTAGDTITGLVEFQAGIGTAMDLNGNDIDGVGTINATTVAATGEVSGSTLRSTGNAVIGGALNTGAITGTTANLTGNIVANGFFGRTNWGYSVIPDSTSNMQNVRVSRNPTHENDLARKAYVDYVAAIYGAIETTHRTSARSSCRGTAVASCPSGWKLLGGGGQFAGTCGCSESLRMVVENRPNGETWRYRTECAYSTAYAVCGR